MPGSTHGGSSHPNLLDDEFYRRAFFTEPLLLASTPYDWREFSKWAAERTRTVLSLRRWAGMSGRT